MLDSATIHNGADAGLAHECEARADAQATAPIRQRSATATEHTIIWNTAACKACTRLAATSPTSLCPMLTGRPRVPGGWKPARSVPSPLPGARASPVAQDRPGARGQPWTFMTPDPLPATTPCFRSRSVICTHVYHATTFRCGARQRACMQARAASMCSVRTQRIEGGAFRERDARRRASPASRRRRT